jgi:hypothetical protein
MRKYTKPAVSEFPLNFISLRLQGTGEPLIGTNCTGCPTFGLPSLCDVEGTDDYFFNLILEDTTCDAASLDVSTCTITVGANVFTNCGSGIPSDTSCAQDSQDCRVQIRCVNTGNCVLGDDGATVEINCPGFEVCSTNLVVSPD